MNDKSGSKTAIYHAAAMQSDYTLLGMWQEFAPNGYQRAAIFNKDSKPILNQFSVVVGDCDLTPSSALVAKAGSELIGSWKYVEPIPVSTHSQEFKYTVGFTSSIAKEEKNSWSKSVAKSTEGKYMFKGGSEVSHKVKVTETQTMQQSVETAFSMTQEESNTKMLIVPNTPCPDPTTCTSAQSCTNCADPPWTKEFFGLDDGMAPGIWQFHYEIPRSSTQCPSMNGFGKALHMTPARNWEPCCLPGYNIDYRFDGICHPSANGDESPNACCEGVLETAWADHLEYCPTWKTKKNTWWADNGKPKAGSCGLDEACHIAGQFCPYGALGAPSEGLCCVADGIWALNTGATDRATCE